MAGFCTHCGRPLKDDEVCGCQGSPRPVGSDEKCGCQESPRPVGSDGKCGCQEIPRPVGSDEKCGCQGSPRPVGSDEKCGCQESPRPVGSDGKCGCQEIPRPVGSDGKCDCQGRSSDIGSAMVDHTKDSCGANAQQGKKVERAKISFFQNFWALVLNAFKRPADTLHRFALNADFKSALVLISIEAVFSALIVLFSALHLSFGKLFFGGADMAKMAFAQFAFMLIISFGVSILFALYSMLFSISICNSSINFKQALCISGAKSLAIIPFIILSFLLSIFVSDVTGTISAIGNVLSYFFAYFAFRSLSRGIENRAVYGVFFTIVCSIASNILLNFLVNNLLYKQLF